MDAIISLFFWVLAISFLCSLVESVLTSTTPSFVALKKSENKPYAQLLEHLKDNINRPITAIITLNTIVNTLGSALLATRVYERFGSAAASVATGVLTLSILILSEIIPKTLGAYYWRGLAPVSAYIVQTMVIALYPLVWLSEFLTRRIKQDSESHTITREEVIASAELSAEEGEIKKQESKIIKNLLTLNSLYVSDIMTPRSVIFALPADMTVSEAHHKHKPLRFSRIPVFDGNLDQVVGIVMRYQIHECVSMDNDHVKLKELVQPVSFVSEKMTVSGLLEFLTRKKSHIAIVNDEYGSVTGLVTLEDAIETLLGVEIVDELDHVADMRQYALEQWQARRSEGRKP